MTKQSSLNSWERPGMEIPPMVRAVFACAVYDFGRSDLDTEAIRKALQQQYISESFFMEAVTAVYECNEWPVSADVRKKFRKVFRARTSLLK
jgi:hypothetical protein